jgi:hypothetical protein
MYLQKGVICLILLDKWCGITDTPEGELKPYLVDPAVYCVDR